MSDNLRYVIDADDNPVKQALGRVAGQFKALEGGVGNVMAGITSQFGKLNGVIAGTLAVLAGGAGLKASVDATKEFTIEANKLARVLGTNATEASTLNVALGDVYADTDTFTAAAGKLAKELRTNESALRDMGLQTRDASGNLRPLKDLMMDSITVVNSYKQGIDRNIAAQAVWGKGAEEASALLKLNNQVLDEARAKQEALGLVVGVENVEATKAYRAAMNDVGDVLLGLRKAIGDAVMPVLTQLGVWFSELGPAAVTVIKGAIGGLVSTFWALHMGVVVVWETLNAMVISLTEPLRAFGAAIRKMLTGDMEGAANELRNVGNVVKGAWNKALIEIGDTAEKTRARVGNLFGQATPVPQAAPQGRSAAGMVKSGKDDSQFQAWQAELNALKQSHAEKNAAEGTFFEFSKEREKSFWESKRQLATSGSKDAFAVQAQITTATLALQKDAFEERMAQLKREGDAAQQDLARKAGVAQQELQLITQRYGAESKQAEDARRKIDEIERQSRDQRKALRDLEVAEIAAAGNQQVELERQRQRLLFDAGVLTREELLANEAAYEQRRFQLQQQALQQRLALVDPTNNPIEYARIKNEMLELERQYQLQMAEIQGQATLAHTQQFRGMFASIESSWANSIRGVLSGAQTITQGIRGLFKGITDAVIAMLAQMVAQWVVRQIMMRVLGKTLALSTIAGEAAKAGAGGVASMAAAPWPLNMAAPAFGAAMYGAALAFAPAASAAGGFDIPFGMNPITQLHQEEMVLPQEQANVIRGMADGGGGGGSPVVIQAWDGRSVERWLMNGGADLLGNAMRDQRRANR